MDLEDRVLISQTNVREKEAIITEYRHFISSCAYKTLGRFITEQDDEMSIAMIAFHEAIDKYNPSKGKFLHFAGINIKNRLIDYHRKMDKHACVYPFSSISPADENGDAVEFDIADTTPFVNDIKYEIEALAAELKLYEITFSDLAKMSPKSKKTKVACAQIACYILKTPALLEGFLSNHKIPIQKISDNLKLSRKIAERHRKYIIAAVLVFSGEYDMIAEYFGVVKEVLSCRE